MTPADSNTLGQGYRPGLETIWRPRMRIGEIAVVGPDSAVKSSFIRSGCDEIVVQNQHLIFGRLRINSQLMLHLYGLDYHDEQNNPSWDLVAKKLLGYIILFDWSNPVSFAAIESAVDALPARYRLPVVVAASLDNNPESLPSVLMNADLNVSRSSEFTFCNTAEPESVKRVLATLVDSVIAKLD